MSANTIPSLLQHMLDHQAAQAVGNEHEGAGLFPRGGPLGFQGAQQVPSVAVDSVPADLALNKVFDLGVVAICEYPSVRDR